MVEVEGKECDHTGTPGWFPESATVGRMRRSGLLAVGLLALFVTAAEGRHRRIVCMDGAGPRLERVRRLAVACDTDGLVDDMCTFSFPTGLLCIDCPRAVVTQVPLNGQRRMSQRLEVGLFRGRVVCRRARSN
jgi:hypothetical protein